MFALMLISRPLMASDEGWLDPIFERIDNAINVYEVALEFHYIENALNEYEEARGRPLSIEAGLRILVREGYLDEDDIRDPWGTPYQFRRSIDPQGGFLIYLFSAGPDRTHGTEDDLGN